jgi:hypothetical protein
MVRGLEGIRVYLKFSESWQTCRLDVTVEEF